MSSKNINKRTSLRNFFIALIILISLNLISAFYFVRLDMTAEKRYTLSEYTKQTLENLPGNVYITVYLDGRDLPLPFKKFRREVREILDEFKAYAGSKLNYEFVNPTSEDMDDDQRIALYKHLSQLGIIPIENQEITEGSARRVLIFPSAVLTYSYYDEKGDSLITKEVGLNLLNNDPNYDQASLENINNSVQTLEYKFISTIKKLISRKKPKIAFITGHGELPELFVIGAEQALSEYYDVRRGNIGGQYGILDTFAAIIIAKPTLPFPERDKFVIDQYIMKGGKVLWLIDGTNVDMDSIYYYDMAFAMPAFTQILKIDDQLFTYGVRINTNLIQDLRCSKIMLKGESQTGQQTTRWFNWLYFPVIISDNSHVINKYIDALKTEFVSSIDTVGKNPKIKKIPLLKTSEFSRIIPVNVPVQITFKEITEPIDRKKFNKKDIPIAYLLEGSFPSLYKGRIVNKYLPEGAKFLEESVPTKMIVVADGDIIKNAVKSTGEPMPLGFDKYSLMIFKGNKQFIINALNYLTDDEGLMSLRSRKFILRLLDQRVVAEQKTFWQIFNVVTPIALVLILGILIVYFRKLKYAK